MQQKKSAQTRKMICAQKSYISLQYTSYRLLSPRPQSTQPEGLSRHSTPGLSKRFYGKATRLRAKACTLTYITEPEAAVNTARGPFSKAVTRLFKKVAMQGARARARACT